MNPLRWRKMTWAIVVFSVLMLVWAIAGAASNPGVTEEEIQDCVADGFFTRQECQDTLEAAGDVGTGIGVTLIFILWFIGFIILSIIWFMTRRRGRVCPHCGEDVKGRTTCQSCGYDFAIGGKPPAAAPPPSAPTQGRRGGKRWTGSRTGSAYHFRTIRPPRRPSSSTPKM